MAREKVNIEVMAMKCNGGKPMVTIASDGLMVTNCEG